MSTLLEFFVEEVGYKAASKHIKLVCAGCKGFVYDGKKRLLMK